MAFTRGRLMLPLTTQARVKVIAYDAAANSGEDISDANFTISDGTDRSVTVTDPNGGEIWEIDSFFDIMWVATDNIGVTSIDILLSTDGGATFPTTIATGEANDGVYSWEVDVPPTTQARVKVIAHDAAGNSGEDTSDGNFDISMGRIPCYSHAPRMAARYGTLEVSTTSCGPPRTISA